VRGENALRAIVYGLVVISEAHGMSAAQIALACALGRPTITSLIIGGRSEAQFRENLASVQSSLPTRSARGATRRASCR
jgi:aryl-alcohol dehydrogenase-like predicted oxidoreductase